MSMMYLNDAILSAMLGTTGATETQPSMTNAQRRGDRGLELHSIRKNLSRQGNFAHYLAHIKERHRDGRIRTV